MHECLPNSNRLNTLTYAQVGRQPTASRMQHAVPVHHDNIWHELCQTTTMLARAMSPINNRCYHPNVMWRSILAFQYASISQYPSPRITTNTLTRRSDEHTSELQ